MDPFFSPEKVVSMHYITFDSYFIYPPVLFPFTFSPLKSLLLFSHSVVSKYLRLHGLQHARLSLSFPISWRLLRLKSIASVISSSHLILCCPLLLLPSVFPSIRVFSNELTLHIKWPKNWSFSISFSNEYSGLISCRIDWLDLLAVQGLSRGFSSIAILKYQFFGAQPSL